MQIMLAFCFNRETSFFFAGEMTLSVEEMWSGFVAE
jgi:hypothetical protein